MRSKEIYNGYTVYEDGRILGKRGKFLSPYDNGKGYLIVAMRINGKSTSKAIHRLLGEAFIPNTNSLSDVDHIDGNRRNNKLENLRWVTHGENIEHSYNLENRSAVGANNARCIHSEADVIRICELLQEGFTSALIRDKGFDYSLVRGIKASKRWVHISANYNW